ncbi:MAG: amidohydrolase [Bacteroidetes bacterium]|nr:amidohydrolase [Bacteroidota bacterium]
MPNLTPSDFLAAAKRRHDRLIEIRRTLHMNPELAFEEYDTSALVQSVLGELGMEMRTGVAKTGVVGVLRGGAATDGSRCVALRGDMDALPIQEETGLPFASKNAGKMHACGHDSHTTMALGAAMVLTELREHLPGTVKFLLQPSEEKLPGGASVMVAEGALDGPKVDMVFGQHVAPRVAAGTVGFYPGTILASADEIYITIRGVGGHAALPQATVDPIVTACQLVVALQTVVSRTLDPFKPGVLTIGKIAGGTATNIIPDEVRLEGTLRAMDEEWRRAAHTRIEDTIRGICIANGAEYELNINLGYPALNNDPWATHFAQEAARELLGTGAVYDAAPMMGAEDFAYYLEKVPGTFWWIGAGTPEQGCNAGLHNPKFTINEDILPVGSALMAWVAYRYLTQAG